MRMSYGAAVKIAEVALGLTLLYFRFCLYETEEGQLENVLVAFWLRASDCASSTRARFGRLLQETAQISLRLFDAAFGRKTISLRAISASSLLVFVSVSTAMFGFEKFIDPKVYVPVPVLLFSIALLFAAFAPGLIRRSWATWIPIVTFFLLFGLYAIISMALVWTGSIRDDQTALVIYSFILIVAALFVDFIWLVAVRAGTQWAANGSGIWRHALVILICAAAALGSFAGFAEIESWDSSDSAGVVYEPPYLTVSRTIIFWGGASRFFLVSISIVQLVVLLVAFAHWVIWPLLSRAVYAADRYQFFKERKFFGTIGVVLIGHAAAGTWLADAIKPLWEGK